MGVHRYVQIKMMSFYFILTFIFILMEKQNMLILVTIVVVEIILVVAVASVMLNNEDNAGDEVYKLYIGLKDSTTHEDYDPDEAADIVDAIVVKYNDGLTRYISNGRWVDNGYITNEKTLVYEIAGIDVNKAHKIADEAKVALNQDSIMITMSKEKVEFY